LKGTGFSPYITGYEELAALAAEGMSMIEKNSLRG
jgi:hypothetical protein